MFDDPHDSIRPDMGESRYPDPPDDKDAWPHGWWIVPAALAGGIGWWLILKAMF